MSMWSYGGEETKITAQDDLLHPAPANEPSWIETNYFCFHIPEHRINGLVHLTFRPNLKIVASWVTVWQGNKKTILSAEHQDWRCFVPYPAGDLDDFELESGVRIKCLEPMQRYQVDYANAKGDTRFNMVFDAIMPPAPYPGGAAHFDQAGKVDGMLLLAGKEYKIDCFAARDHSWGPRSEAPLAAPPMSWLHGIFGRDFAFHLMAIDDAESQPEWAGTYPAPPTGKNILGGYLFKDGVVHRIVTARKKTEREADGITHRSHKLELVDDAGTTYTINGEVTANLPSHFAGNWLIMEAQMRWECAGRTGWGEAEDVLSSDFVRRFGP